MIFLSTITEKKLYRNFGIADGGGGLPKKKNVCRRLVMRNENTLKLVVNDASSFSSIYEQNKNKILR